MMTLLNGKENTSLRFLAFDNIAVDERKKLIGGLYYAWS